MVRLLDSENFFKDTFIRFDRSYTNVTDTRTDGHRMTAKAALA